MAESSPSRNEFAPLVSVCDHVCDQPWHDPLVKILKDARTRGTSTTPHAILIAGVFYKDQEKKSFGVATHIYTQKKAAMFFDRGHACITGKDDGWHIAYFAIKEEAEHGDDAFVQCEGLTKEGEKNDYDNLELWDVQVDPGALSTENQQIYVSPVYDIEEPITGCFLRYHNNSGPSQARPSAIIMFE